MADVNLDTGDDPEGESTSSGEPAVDVTGELGSTGAEYGSGEGSGGAGTSGSTGEAGESGSTGEPGPECFLPHVDSWCASQREVAYLVGCKSASDPESCLRTIGAQYYVSDLALLTAGICSTAESPDCPQAYLACSAAAGSPDCLLLVGQGVAECQALAEQAGVAPVQATLWCQVIVDALAP